MNRFIDTHSHIFDEKFDEDREQAVFRAKENGVDRLIIPSIDSSTHQKVLDCCSKWEGCYPAIGLHPTDVKANYLEELEIVKSYVDKYHEKLVAIGEIGLDLYWSDEFYAEQIEALNFQIELALKYNKPVIIHSRDAFENIEEQLHKYEGRGLKVISHGYSSDIYQFNRFEAMDCEFLYGIGGVVTFKKSLLPQFVEQIPLSKIVLETDCPYLAPTPNRGKRNESAFIPIIAQKIAEIKSVTLEEVAKVTTNNVEKFFNI